MHIGYGVLQITTIMYLPTCVQCHNILSKYHILYTWCICTCTYYIYAFIGSLVILLANINFRMCFLTLKLNLISPGTTRRTYIDIMHRNGVF